jgi:CheY-like chemotaxis protein
MRDVPEPRILLVESEDAAEECVREVLQEMQYAEGLHVARSREDALEFLRLNGEHPDGPRPTLVLLALDLPAGQGPDILREVKAESDLRRIPVVVFTGPDLPESAHQAYRMHANCCVSKPSNPKKYRHVVRRAARFWLETVRLPVS